MYVLIIWTILKYSGLQVGWFVLHIGHNEDYLFNNIMKHYRANPRQACKLSSLVQQ